MKHLEVRQKYSAAHCIFNSLLSLSSSDETLRLMLDILLEVTNTTICIIQFRDRIMVDNITLRIILSVPLKHRTDCGVRQTHTADLQTGR